MFKIRIGRKCLIVAATVAAAIAGAACYMRAGSKKSCGCGK